MTMLVFNDMFMLIPIKRFGHRLKTLQNILIGGIYGCGDNIDEKMDSEEHSN